MPGKAAKKSKRDALKRHGTLNPHPNAVTDPLVETGDFFDRDDVVQVKYEMLRRVTVDEQSVTQSAAAFGFSRPTYYQAEADFQRLRYTTPGKRSFAAPSGLGCCHPGTVRCECSSTEYRRRTEAAGKKKRR